MPCQVLSGQKKGENIKLFSQQDKYNFLIKIIFKFEPKLMIKFLAV